MKPTVTHVAYCGLEETRYHGYSVFGDLTGNESLLGMTGLALLGRRLLSDEQEILDLLTVLLTAADPRIWPLKTARLVAVMGSAESGILAGMATLRGSRIGPETVCECAAALSRVRTLCDSDSPDDATLTDAAQQMVGEQRFIPGFGAPGRPFDQRLFVLDDHMIRLNREHLLFYRIKNAVIRAVHDRHPRAVPNITIGVAAVCLDMGLVPKDMGPLFYLLSFNSFLSNAVEAASDSPPEWVRLPESSVRYVGPSPRQSPRSQKVPRHSRRP